MSDIIKPCPWCGGKVEIGYFARAPHIRCDECEYEREFYFDHGGPMPKKTAIAVWNQRVKVETE